MARMLITGLLNSAPFVLLGEMAPYLLLGFLVAGILSVTVSPQKIKQHLGGHGLWPVLKATIFGIPLPLCSCGVIPVAASLKRYKASNGASDPRACPAHKVRVAPFDPTLPPALVSPQSWVLPGTWQTHLNGQKSDLLACLSARHLQNCLFCHRLLHPTFSAIKKGQTPEKPESGP